ncbi:alcohol dehydrogenase catalytic domain-containing protein [Streptomyces sp. NPDC048362]|uniref:alcohol dehydrogenase catalytic domain-containing protein n=1 Tax=Streptomyces sp. NPDC048362 TaxID=3365539 RepID=UPI0037160F56
MVRSYHVSTGGGIDGLSLRTHEPRTPKVGEVAVAVHATSLSFRELLVLRGQYVLPVKPGVIPVSDGAGEVVAVGPDVRRVRPGDRVTAALFPAVAGRPPGTGIPAATGWLARRNADRAGHPPRGRPRAHPRPPLLRRGGNSSLRRRHGMERSTHPAAYVQNVSRPSAPHGRVRGPTERCRFVPAGRHICSTGGSVPPARERDDDHKSRGKHGRGERQETALRRDAPPALSRHQKVTWKA